jgi:Na+-driven multidrug efflux pump
VKMWKIAFPVALCSLFQFLNNSSTSIYAGHLGDIELSSFSVYQSVITPIYYSLLVSYLIPLLIPLIHPKDFVLCLSWKKGKFRRETL